MSQNNAIASLARLFCAGAEQRSMVVNAVIAILSMFVYVLETLRPRFEINESGCEPEYGSYGASVFFGITGVILTADYIAVATKKGWQVSFLLSPLALCDFACSLPVGLISLLILLTKNEVLDNCDACCGTRRMHAVHILVVLRLFKLLRVSTMISGESARNVMSFGIQLSSLVMVFTAMIASLEDISFPEGLYFSVVSITTVGFGDVSILRTISRLTVISLVLTTMIMIPMQSHSLFNNQRSGNKDPQARQQIQWQEEEESQNEETAPLQENELNARGNKSATEDGADVPQGPSSSLARGNRQSNHVIICGTITNGLFQFFEEFFHPDHGRSLKPKVLLISDDLQAKLALRMVSSSLERAHFLRLMSGAAYSTPVLNRASMTSARRVYILGNSETGAADADDRQTVLITCTAFATLKAYIRNVGTLEDEDSSTQQSQLRLIDQSFPSRRMLSRDASSRASGLQTTLFVKILRQRSRRMLEELILRDERASLRDRVKILCVEEMKMQILARACMCPGFSAFISNLCRSTSSKLIDKTRVLLDAAPRSRHSGESNEDLSMNPDLFEEHPSDIAWCQEYVDGAANEIYQVPTGSAFSGLTFAEMSIILFEEAGILVLGLSMRSASDLDARILLNPSDFVIPADPSKIRLQSLVIAPDLAEAGLANVDAQPGKVTGAKPSATTKSFRFGLGRSSRKPHTILLAQSNVPEPQTSGLRFTSALSTRKMPAPTSTRISRRMFRTTRIVVRQKYATKNNPAANGAQSAMYESGNFSVISLRIRLRAKRAVEASRPEQLHSNIGGLGILSPGLNVGIPNAHGASHTLPSSPKAGRNIQSRLALDGDANAENPTEAVPEDTSEDPQERYEASTSSDASEHSPAQACLFGDHGGLPANEYHLAPREFCQEDVLVYKSALSEIPGLRKHIIVYGDGADCSELVLQLRGRKTGLAAPIIILSRGPIGHRSWNRISQFAQVYLVRGPPELTSTWRRAGIQRAARVILAAAPSTSSCAPGDPRRRANTDARSMRGADEETLLLYNLVLKENRRVRVSCVLRHNVNVQYMQRRLSTTEVLPNLNDNEEMLLSPAIASGTVLCDELFDTIMAQTNYNPHLLKLLSALLKGSREKVQKATNSEAHASQFYHLGVTPEMARLSYGEIFRILASRAILPVYLHRGVERDTRRGHLGNPEPYVVTSPIGATRLFVVDSLICLALQNPLRGEAIPELGIEPEDTAELDGFAYDLEPVSSGSFSTVATTEATEMSGPLRRVGMAAVEAGQQDTEDAIIEHKRAAKRAKLLRQRDELEACKASLRQQIQDVREYLALVRASVQM